VKEGEVVFYHHSMGKHSFSLQHHLCFILLRL
jgi:hypothetical protein